MKKNIDYILISELPEEQQLIFTHWLRGQTCPVVEGEKDSDCAYKHDYDLWLKYYLKNKTAPVYD